MTKLKKTESCSKVFKKMEILPFYSQYIFSLIMYIIKNKHSFTKNWEIHGHNTRTANNLHVPAVNTTKYKKGIYYMGSKIFNHLPNHLKSLVDKEKVFKKALKRFLINNVFYSIDEFLAFKH